MRVLKIVLSWVALFVAAAGGALQNGALHVSGAVGDVVMAGGTLLGVLGYSPWTLTPAQSAALRTVSAMCAAVVLAHAKTVVEQPPGTPVSWTWVFTVIGVAGTIIGIAAYSPIKHAPPPVQQ